MLNTTYNSATTSTVSVFSPVDIIDAGAWPGHPPRPRDFANPDGTISTVNKPLITMINPRWYFKYIRVVVENAWGRVIHMPPNSTTDITADRSRVGGGEIAAWGLWFAHKENQDLRIDAWRVHDERNIYPQPRGILRYQNSFTVGQCRVAVWPQVDRDHADLIDSWNMRDGSVLFDGGHNFYSVTNTGPNEQTLIVLTSTRASDCERILNLPNGRVKRR